MLYPQCEVQLDLSPFLAQLCPDSRGQVSILQQRAAPRRQKIEGMMQLLVQLLALCLPLALAAVLPLYTGIPDLPLRRYLAPATLHLPGRRKRT